MSYLSAAEYSQIVADPASIWSIYQSHRTTFISDLGSAFSGQCEEHIYLAFCNVVAFHWPYGNSVKFDLRSLLAEPHLDCDNYVALAWQLFLLVYPSSQTVIRACGWNGGPNVGNHAQMDAKTPGSPNIYCDPTIALFVNDCARSDLLAHRTYTSAQMKSFYATETKTWPGLDTFNDNVIAAVQGGMYDGDYDLYCCESFDQFSRIGQQPISSWPTAQSLRCASGLAIFPPSFANHLQPVYMEKLGSVTRVRGAGAGCDGNGWTAIPPGKSITFTPSSLGCAFRIMDTNGNVADVKAPYKSSTANLLITPMPGSSSQYAATATPTTPQIGISKNANDMVVTVKNGSLSTVNIYIELDKDSPVAVTDPA